MKSRLFPFTEEFFTGRIEPLIEGHYKRPGRPAKNGHYHFFCGVLYILRTGVSWRDLPECFGRWHTVYMRFKRWSESGLFWSLVCQLQQKKAVKLDFAWVDSTTINLHRHGADCLKKEVHNLLAEDAKD